MSDHQSATIDDDEPFDPDQREMCADGMCVGVIGPDGRCRVCGKPGAGGPKAKPKRDDAEGEVGAVAALPPDEWRPSAVPGLVAAEEPSDPEEPTPPAGGHPNWERERVPCADGMCIGVIGKNGRCGTCKKSWDWKEGE